MGLRVDSSVGMRLRTLSRCGIRDCNRRRLLRYWLTCSERVMARKNISSATSSDRSLRIRWSCVLLFSLFWQLGGYLLLSCQTSKQLLLSGSQPSQSLLQLFSALAQFKLWRLWDSWLCSESMSVFSLRLAAPMSTSDFSSLLCLSWVISLPETQGETKDIIEKEKAYNSIVWQFSRRLSN